MKVLWLDLETTGTSSFKNGIVQACFIIEIDHEIRETKVFFMNPEKEISEEALTITGQTRERIAGYPPVAEVFPKIRDLLCKYVNKFDKADKFLAGGFNIARFDIAFLSSLWYSQGDKYFFSLVFPTFLDVMNLYGMALDLDKTRKLTSYKLESVAMELGVWAVGAHDAEIDTKMTRDCYYKLVERITGELWHGSAKKWTED